MTPYFSRSSLKDPLFSLFSLSSLLSVSCPHIPVTSICECPPGGLMQKGALKSFDSPMGGPEKMTTNFAGKIEFWFMIFFELTHNFQDVKRGAWKFFTIICIFYLLIIYLFTYFFLFFYLFIYLIIIYLFIHLFFYLFLHQGPLPNKCVNGPIVRGYRGFVSWFLLCSICDFVCLLFGFGFVNFLFSQ